MTELQRLMLKRGEARERVAYLLSELREAKDRVEELECRVEEEIVREALEGADDG